MNGTVERVNEIERTFYSGSGPLQKANKPNSPAETVKFAMRTKNTQKTA